MKIYHYSIGLLCLLIVFACSKDLGNYDYHEINELDIQEVEEHYSLRTGVDTLRITPLLNPTIDESDPSRYHHLWILRLGTSNFDTIAREKDLTYPVSLAANNYNLFYRVLDKETGVTWVANTELQVSTAYSKGLLLIGENEAGFAEAEMLSMLSDTVHITQILAKTELPPLSGPISFFHTGGSVAYRRLWAMTASGSYFLDLNTMAATTNNSLQPYVFISEDINPETLHPVVVAPQIRTAAGAIGSPLYRALVTIGGDVFAAAPVLLGGDYYNNPVNRVAAAPDVRIPAAPYLCYPIGLMNNIMWYDTLNERFLNFSGIAIATTSTVLGDNEGDPFPWNQPAGRTLVYAENTRNTDGNSTNGNSFAIMKDSDHTCHIYKFYANGTNPAKRAAYTVKPIAKDFAQADCYAFSSQRSVVFYSVGNTLYAYDYNPGFEKIYTFPEVGNDEITMLKFDTQIDHLTNSLYIATYNTESKGTLRRFLLGLNPNVVELLLQDNSTWIDLLKVKDINWRAVD